MTTTAPAPRADAHGPSVLQIGTGWFEEDPGGLSRVFYHLLRQFDRSGIRARGLVLGKRDWSAATDGLVHTAASPDAPMLARWRGVRRTFDRLQPTLQPDLVAAHFALYAFPLLDRLARQPLVVHFHGPWAAECRVEGAGALSTTLRHALERRVYRQARRLIVLSSAFADVLHRSYRIPRDRIRIIPGGVDVDRFDVPVSRREARERLGWPADRPIVLSVRRLGRRMGLENLVHAFDQVRRRCPEALLLVAGKGPLAARLDALIRERALERHVRLLGFVSDEDLPLAYRAADLTAVPTTRLEGFGLITVESLAAGTPVLVTPVGGLPEVVRDLSENLILPGPDVPHLVDGLSSALTGAGALPDAAACWAYARERYDWSVVASRTLEAYRRAV